MSVERLSTRPPLPFPAASGRYGLAWDVALPIRFQRRRTSPLVSFCHHRHFSSFLLTSSRDQRTLNSTSDPLPLSRQSVSSFHRSLTRPQHQRSSTAGMVSYQPQNRGKAEDGLWDPLIVMASHALPFLPPSFSPSYATTSKKFNRWYIVMLASSTETKQRTTYGILSSSWLRMSKNEIYEPIEEMAPQRERRI